VRVVRALLRLMLGKRPPTWDGVLEAEGLTAPVEVRRDRFGVAYIDAANDHDVWFGLGFCHGQDRAGQLEVTARLIRGTLAEVAGPDALPLDRLSRRLGIAHAARRQLAVADPDIAAQLDAYARGINVGMRRGGRRRAHELALLGCPPTPWEAADAQGFSALMCFALAANWDVELVRLRILERHGPEALAALDPTTPEWLHATLPPGSRQPSAADALAADARAFQALVGAGGGSNAWVVAGSRTASGRPILANDPHLPAQVPAMWYLARLATPSWRCAGATFVGAPAIGPGHNGVAAWGVTALHADVTDLFLEEVGPDGQSVRAGDAFVPCAVREEVIAVKGRKEPVVERVLETPRGPIVGPALDGAPEALSIAASWLQPRPYRGLLGIHAARTVEDFRRINDQAATANTSICFALAEGTIGWLASADVPERRFGYGTLPLPGWDPRVGWGGVVDKARMPFGTDPTEGFFVTANNAPVGAERGAEHGPEHGAAPPFLGIDWLDGYRATAIGEALARRRDWDLAATGALQTQTRSPVWPEVREVVLGAPAGEGPAADAQAMLRAWDGDVAADSAGASLWVFFTAAIVHRIVAEKAPDEVPAALGRGATELLPYNLLFARRLSHLSRLLRERPAGFFAGEVTWEGAVVDALGEAFTTLRRRFGQAEARWAWGRVRPLWLRHPFGDKRALDGTFNVRGLVCGGDASTIAQASVDLEDPTKNPIGVATLRAVIDVGAWDASRWVLLGGQSGNPMVPAYADQVPLHARGEGLPIWWSDARRDEDTAHSLRLTPAAAPPEPGEGR